MCNDQNNATAKQTALAGHASSQQHKLFKAEIDAEIQNVVQIKHRHKYAQTAAVHLMWVGGAVSIGFNFREGVKVGDIYKNDDGSQCEVVALV